MSISVNTQSLITYMSDVDAPSRKENKKERFRLLVDKESGDVRAQLGEKIHWWVRLFAKLGFGPAYIGNVNAALREKKDTVEKDLKSLEDKQVRQIKDFTLNLKKYNKNHSFLKKIKDIVSFTIKSEIDSTKPSEEVPTNPLNNYVDMSDSKDYCNYIQQGDYANAWKLIESIEDLSKVYYQGKSLILWAMPYAKQNPSGCIDFIKKLPREKCSNTSGSLVFAYSSFT